MGVKSCVLLSWPVWPVLGNGEHQKPPPTSAQFRLIVSASTVRSTVKFGRLLFHPKQPPTRGSFYFLHFGTLALTGPTTSRMLQLTNRKSRLWPQGWCSAYHLHANIMPGPVPRPHPIPPPPLGPHYSQAPILFFDSTPIGRIVNRFSKDQRLVDTSILPTVSLCLSALVSPQSLAKHQKPFLPVPSPQNSLQGSSPPAPSYP